MLDFNRTVDTTLNLKANRKPSDDNERPARKTKTVGICCLSVERSLVSELEAFL